MRIIKTVASSQQSVVSRILILTTGYWLLATIKMVMPDGKSSITGDVRDADFRGRPLGRWRAAASRALAGRRGRRLGGLLGLLLLLRGLGQLGLRLARTRRLVVEVLLGLRVAGHLGELRLLAQEVGLLRPGVRVVLVERDGLLGELQPLGGALLGLVEVGLVGGRLVVDEDLVGLLLRHLVLLLLGDVVGALPLLRREDDEGLGALLRRDGREAGALGQKLAHLVVVLHLPVEVDYRAVGALVAGVFVQNVLVGGYCALAYGQVLRRVDARLVLLLDGAGDEERRVLLRRVEFVGGAKLRLRLGELSLAVGARALVQGVLGPNAVDERAPARSCDQRDEQRRDADSRESHWMIAPGKV